MTFLPIVTRELALASRRGRSYWLRFWAAFLVLLIWAGLLAETRSLGPAARGLLLWEVSSIVSLCFCLLAGVFLTADCLSSEKREGTLGLLFLTDLRGYDVVLGKLTAASLQSFFLLLAALPVFNLTVLVGGASGGEFARLSLLFVVTLLFSLSMGLAASASSTGARQAIVRALGLIVFFTTAGPVFCLFVGLLLPRFVPVFFDWPSPGYAFLAAFDVHYRAGGAFQFWLSLAAIFAIAVGGIVFASRKLPREWDAAEDAPPLRPLLPAKFRKIRHGFTSLKRKAMLRWNPVFWLGVRDPGPRRTAILALVSLIGLWFAFSEVIFLVRPASLLFTASQPVVISLLAAYGLHFVTKAYVALETTRRWSLDRQSGALELLLVTPVPIESIIKGQEQALWRQLRWPLAILCFINFGLFFAVASNSNTPSFMGLESLLLLLLASGMAFLVADFHAIVWVGMWCAVNGRGQLRAALGTLARVIGVAWLALLPILILVPARGGPGSGVGLAFWFCFCAVFDIVLSANAKRKLRQHFRLAASEGPVRHLTAQSASPAC